MNNLKMTNPKIISVRHRIFLFLMLILVSSTSISADFKSSVGIGLQYGGVVGWQVSSNLEKNNVHFGFGFLGLSAGYKYSLTEKVSVGVQGFVILFAQGGGINVNYNFTSASASGWVVGLDVLRMVSTYSDEAEERKIRAFVSVGYKF